MLNQFVSKIEFEVLSEERAREIYDSICVYNEFDFETLAIPSFHDFCETMGREKQLDDIEAAIYDQFKFFWFSDYRRCEISELKWLGEKASFTFQTLWNVPSEVVVGFANTFNVPFTYKFFEKGGTMWGIEIFELDENERVRKTSDRVCMEEDFRDLHLDLMGYEINLDDLLVPLHIFLKYDTGWNREPIIRDYYEN